MIAVFIERLLVFRVMILTIDFDDYFLFISDAINFSSTSYIPLLIRVSERSLIF